ncbi:MAG: hypothetical protein GF364_04840 [Candidatus Lokiarchaeota archaeon]|nr:hypothetical protein [Candidatus Lokiarchaeota archaeon]
MMDILALYPQCPHCGKKIGYFNRIEHCAYSDELVCNKCIVSGRFSDSVVEKIPNEFREKFRIFNMLPWLVIALIALLMIQSGWYRFGGWALSNVDKLLENVLYIFGMVLGGLLLLLITTRLPHLGTWMFYWWISKPKNKKKLEEAVNTKEEGRYVSTNRLYSLKRKIIDYLKNTQTRDLFIVTIILNSLMLIFFPIMQNKPYLAGTYFSAIVGIIWSLTLVCNILVLLVAAGFYSHKKRENKKQRVLVEVFSWTYILLFPFIFIPFIIGKIWSLNAFEELADELAGINFGPMLVLYQVIFIVQTILIILTVFYLLLKATPDYNLQNERKISWSSKSLKLKIKQIPKSFITILLLAVLIFAFAFSLLMIVVDPAMALGIVAPTYVLVGLFLPVIYATLKLIPRRPKKYKQIFWRSVKISAVIVAICAAPAILTPTWTNRYIEDQFDVAFGDDWETQISDDLQSKFRKVPYSAYENFFGFEISYEGAALYDVFYMYDSPRYVKAPDGTILSNGSSKFTEAKRAFTFDIYLPPNEEFGVGSNKYPLIMFCHGVGMAKGTGNANFSVSRYFANQGYTVVDMEYGRTGWVTNRTNIGHDGYDFPDTCLQVANCTKFLDLNQEYYHVDMSNVWFSGRSFGGWMATVLAYGYNLPFFAGNFSETMVVRGSIPMYGAHAILEAGELLTLDMLGDDGLGVMDVSAPYVRGSPNPEDPDYNPEWIFYNPYKMIDPSINGGFTACPTLMIHGTQDPLVPPGWDIQLKSTLESYGSVGIAALYPLGSHATDVIHWSHYGQSVLYYMERFLALTGDF